jgi:hypothetical protein
MAGNAQGIRAGKAYVEVGTDNNPLNAGLRIAEAKVRAFGQSIGALGKRFLQVGVAVATPFLGAAKLFADAGSELADMSSRTGMTVESLSELQYAAQQTGTDLAGVEAAARKMQKGLGEAALGSDDAKVAFEALGLSVDALLKMSPDRQFQTVAKAISYIHDPTLQAAAAMKVFGKSGTVLLPMIADMGTLTKRARDLGLVMSREDAESADELGDAIDTLTAAVKRTVVVIGAALGPVLTEAADWLSGAGKETRDWILAHQQLIPLIFKAGVALAGLGAGIVVVGEAFEGAASILGPLQALIAGLFTPLGLVVAAATAAGVAFVTLTETGQRAFRDLLKIANDTIKGIGDALAAGDIALAGKILWLGLKLEWEKGIGFLKTKWADFANYVGSTFDLVTRKIAGFFIDVGAKIQEVIASTFEMGNLDAKVKEIEENRQVAQRALDDQLNANKQARADDRAQAIADLQKELDQARADFKAAVGQAAVERGEVAGKKPGKKPQRLKGVDLAELDNAVQSAQRKVDVSGSFSADALKGLGIGDSVANDQLKEQKKQTTELQRLNARIRNAALVFQD